MKDYHAQDMLTSRGQPVCNDWLMWGCTSPTPLPQFGTTLRSHLVSVGWLKSFYKCIKLTFFLCPVLLTSFSPTGADSENISLQANLHVKICFHGTLTWNTIFIFSEVLPKDVAVTPLIGLYPEAMCYCQQPRFAFSLKLGF